MLDVSRRLSDGAILQSGTGLGELDGCEIVVLDADQEAAYRAASWPNGGLTLSGEGAITVAPAPPPPKTRLVTLAEYKAEFATATDARRQVIRDIAAGLVDRESVSVSNG